MSKKAELVAFWEEHTRCEFAAHDVDGTMATMSEKGAHILNAAVVTGSDNLAEIREFYSKAFIPYIPPDTAFVSPHID